MAKSKKNIGAFQKAMLSNTKMIKADNNIEKKVTSQKTYSSVKNKGLTDIDPEISKKLQKMSEKYGIEQNHLINKGLDLFLSLEEFWFKEN